MKLTLTADERRALQRLAGLPEKLTPRSRPERDRVPLDELCRVLDRPSPPHSELLAPDLWLAGSTPVRWLCGRLEHGEGRERDFDLFVSSLDAWNRAGRELMGAGFRFRCFRSVLPFCARCGEPGEVVGTELPAPGAAPVTRIRCPHCGELGVEDALALRPEELVEIEPAHVETFRILALELETPAGTKVHVSCRGIAPDPYAAFAAADYSVIQLAYDRDFFYWSPVALTDVLLGRVRVTSDKTPWVTRKRLAKYKSLGFRPYLETTFRVHYNRFTRVPWILRPRRTA